jgi:hypothetical protein
MDAVLRRGSSYGRGYFVGGEQSGWQHCTGRRLRGIGGGLYGGRHNSLY